MAIYFNFNGCGATYYGECDFSSDGSYISTLWLTVIHFPILPLSSAVLLDADKRGEIASFNEVKIPLCYPQVIRTWLYALSLALPIMHYFKPLYFYFIPPSFNTAIYIYPLIILPLPWLLRRRARRKAYQLPPRKRLNLLY